MIWFLVVFNLVNLTLAGWLIYRLRIFPKKPDTSLLELLSQQKTQLNQTFKRMDKLEKALNHLVKEVNMSPLVWSMVRFSAFNQIGAHQSFSLCWLNKRASGYILTNIYSQAGSRFYLKEVVKGKEMVPLSPEEKESLTKALNKLKLISR